MIILCTQPFRCNRNIKSRVRFELLIQIRIGLLYRIGKLSTKNVIGVSKISQCL
jgi:hypothetical protein